MLSLPAKSLECFEKSHGCIGKAIIKYQCENEEWAVNLCNSILMYKNCNVDLFAIHYAIKYCIIMWCNAMTLVFRLTGRFSQWLTRSLSLSLCLKANLSRVCQHLCIGTDNWQRTIQQKAKQTMTNSFCAHKTQNIIKINSNFIRSAGWNSAFSFFGWLFE